MEAGYLAISITPTYHHHSLPAAKKEFRDGLAFRRPTESITVRTRTPVGYFTIPIKFRRTLALKYSSICADSDAARARIAPRPRGFLKSRIRAAFRDRQPDVAGPPRPCASRGMCTISIYDARLLFSNGLRALHHLDYQRS